MWWVAVQTARLAVERPVPSPCGCARWRLPQLTGAEKGWRGGAGGYLAHSHRSPACGAST